jgi:hypothetical protein
MGSIPDICKQMLGSCAQEDLGSHGHMHMLVACGPQLNTLEIPSGAGSGFVWDKEGRIVTNCE